MIARARFWAAVVMGLLGAACSARSIGPPPGAPRVTRPLDAMPADLDLVVRLDLRRMRDSLGASAMTAISEQAVRRMHGEDQATDALLLRALGSTDTLWLGLRPAADLGASDSVLVMSGHFSDFDPHRAQSQPRFLAPLELGGNLRRYDRAEPPKRSAPARIYQHGDDLLVSLSTAEIDSVERSFEQQRGAPALEPSEKGLLSAMARPRILPAPLFAGVEPLWTLAQSAERLELSADLTSVGADATLALKFDDATEAERVAQALNEVRDALGQSPGELAQLAARCHVSSAGPFVSIGLALDRAELSGLVNCRGAACAW